MNKEIIQKDKEEKAIKFYKNYIENQEKELDWMYKQDEEYYRDEIEQKELLIKGFRTILNLIQKQSKIIDKMAEFLEDELTIDEICNKENCYADEYINGHCQKCLNCIKEYFKKVVDEDVKD